MLRGLTGFAALLVLTGQLAAQAPASAQAPGQKLPAPQAGAKHAALVNGQPIPMADVQTLLSQAPPSPTPLTEAQKRQQQITAVQLLIDQALMRQYLSKQAKPATPAEIQKEIDDLQVALKKDKMSLQQFLTETNQTEAQLRSDIALQLQWRTYIATRVTEDTLKNYYAANKVFFDKVFVRASHILIKLPVTASAAERQAAQAKLLALRAEIVAGKIDFADAARKYSDCPSKKNGGDIGPFPYKFVVLEPFAKAAFAMKVGDVSNVVATDFGLHLIKVTNRDPGQPSDYAKIHDQVKEIYAQELHQQIVAEQRRTARVEIFFPPQK